MISKRVLLRIVDSDFVEGNKITSCVKGQNLPIRNTSEIMLIKDAVFKTEHEGQRR